ncbi:xyloglucan glycosyltransferase 4-like protein [Tanacetum coccineum]
MLSLYTFHCTTPHHRLRFFFGHLIRRMVVATMIDGGGSGGGLKIVVPTYHQDEDEDAHAIQDDNPAITKLIHREYSQDDIAKTETLMVIEEDDKLMVFTSTKVHELPMENKSIDPKEPLLSHGTSRDKRAKKEKTMAPSSVVVTINKSSNISLVEVNESSEFLEKKQKTASTKQFSWMLLLKALNFLKIFPWIAMGFSKTFVSVKKRIALSDNGVKDEVQYKERLIYKFIRLFLLVSIIGLFVEFVAYFQKWDLNLDLDFIHEFDPKQEVMGLFQWAYLSWVSFRADYIAPSIMMLSQFCVVLFMIQSLDRFVLGMGCFWIKLKGIKPQIEGDGYDIEDDTSFPMVLVQIPMCDEREVYQQSIASACQLDWPKDRILIQVLDDSSDELLQMLIKNECNTWREKGVNIIYRHRFLRTGYKAGNLHSAMSCDYVKNYEFVAILDADFQPNPDFLTHTVPHFKVTTIASLLLFIATIWVIKNA